MESVLNALREAVKLAPENEGLLQHYIRTLISVVRHAEAEEFLVQWLAEGRQSHQVQLLLAEVFFHQGKNSHALAIVETLCSPPRSHAPALVLQARLQFRAGKVEQAVLSYREAVERDPRLADPEFASLLGIRVPAAGGESECPGGETAEDLIEGRIRIADPSAGAPMERLRLEKPSIRFDQVGGMEQVKEQVRIRIIYPVTHSRIFASYGKQAGGGILMYGPPGCGKTLIARAIAGEVDSHFLAVGINDVLDMWLGNSERNLHLIFEEARRHRPCVLFFDEVDALGASRADLRQNSGRHLVNQFLSELDGVQSSNEGILVLGATNAPWHIDGAFRRPGRFDRVIFVPPPDERAREEILEIILRDRPAAGVDRRKVSVKTAEYSGADLRALVDAAVETRIAEAIRTGHPRPLATADLLAAMKAVRPTTKEWFATARNHALYANQGGTYDDVLAYLRLK